MDALSARQCKSRTLKMNHVEKNALAGLAKTKMPVIKIEKNWVRGRQHSIFCVRKYDEMLMLPFAPT